MKIHNQFMPVAALLLLLLNACKPDATIPPTPEPVTYANYGMLKTGNYWIYQRFTVDSNGNGVATNEFDSCYIEKDTLINRRIYAKSMRPNPYFTTPVPTFLRDSLHYIVTNTGAIVFSSQDFTSVFNHYYHLTPISLTETDTFAEVSSKMVNKNLSYTTDAGTFLTSDYLTTYHMHEPYTQQGTNRLLHMRYAENVGVVSETILFYSSSTTYNELRLVRYHVQ